MKTLLLSIACCLGGPAFADQQAFTIQGLNLNSSPSDVEDLMGNCEKAEVDKEKYDIYMCDGYPNAGFNTYKDTDILTALRIDCMQINGCSYSVKELGDSLTEAFSLKNVIPPSSQTAIYRAKTGEQITIINVVNDKSEKIYFLNIVEGDLRKPKLILD